MKHRQKLFKNCLSPNDSENFLESNPASSSRKHGNSSQNGLTHHGGAHSDNQEHHVWKKILYEKQPFPDDYCSPMFLTEIRKNVTAKTYKFDEAVRGSLIIMHQINSVALYVIMFGYVRERIFTWNLVLISCAITAIFGYAIHAVLQRKNGICCPRANDAKTLALYVGFGYGLSPVFKTLSETISTDTIYAVATLMFFMNIIFADYGIDVAIISSALSLNAGIFGAVCLISRLSSNNEVFTLLTLAVETFVLWPILRWQLLKSCSNSDVFLAITASIFVVFTLWKLSMALTFLYVLLHLFISLVCPLGLMKIQPWKNTIHGPWDEAIIAEAQVSPLSIKS